MKDLKVYSLMIDKESTNYILIYKTPNDLRKKKIEITKDNYVVILKKLDELSDKDDSKVIDVVLGIAGVSAVVCAAGSFAISTMNPISQSDPTLTLAQSIANLGIYTSIGVLGLSGLALYRQSRPERYSNMIKGEVYNKGWVVPNYDNTNDKTFVK